MIRDNKEFLNVTSMRSIRSEDNFKRSTRKSSVGGILSNHRDQKEQVSQSQAQLPHQNSVKTLHKPPLHSAQRKLCGSPDQSAKSGAIFQFNQLLCLQRSNDLNKDIEVIEKFKKEMERAFKELKRLQSQQRESLKAIDKLNYRVKQLEKENGDLERLNGHKDNLIFTLEEKIRMLLDQNLLMQRNKSSHSLDIIVHTQNEIQAVKNQLIDLSKLSPRYNIPKSPKDLTSSTLSIKDRGQLRPLEQKLKVSENSLQFYKQREQQLETHIQQLEKQLQKCQSNSKGIFDTHKDTMMMLLTQAASLESLVF